MNEYGIKVGDTMLYAAQGLNLFREKRTGGNFERSDTLSSRGKLQRMRDAASAEAQKLLHDFKQHQSAGGRRLEEQDDGRSFHIPDPESQTREEKLKTFSTGLNVLRGGRRQRSLDPEMAARAMYSHFNSTRALSPSIRSLERSAQDSRRDRRRKLQSGKQEANNLNTRASLSHRGFVPQKSGLKLLTSAFGAIQASEGSLLRRMHPAMQAMQAAREKHRDLISASLEQSERRRLRREGRRLAEKPADPEDLYKRLDESTAKLGHTHIELPAQHSLSWVHDLVGGGAGWREMHEEGKRMASIEKERRRLREESRLSHARIAELHPTGYSWLDHPGYKPTTLGDFFRRLAARKTDGADPAWVKPRWWSLWARRRRLQKKR